MIKIKTLIYAMLSCMMITGCKTVTVESMTRLGAVSGVTAAYVLNKQVQVDDNTRNTIIDVMKVVEKYVPETNSTYQATWTPIVSDFVQNAVKEGKLTQAQADRVVKDFTYITGLLDAYIEKKGIKDRQDCVDAFIHSFCMGFLTNFKPANSFSAYSIEKVELDEFTEEYLTNAMK